MSKYSYMPLEFSDVGMKILEEVKQEFGERLSFACAFGRKKDNPHIPLQRQSCTRRRKMDVSNSLETNFREVVQCNRNGK